MVNHFHPLHINLVSFHQPIIWLRVETTLTFFR
nr:MAG TPA: hypothetical protein [Caudoviricetes sp.]